MSSRADRSCRGAASPQPPTHRRYFEMRPGRAATSFASLIRRSLGERWRGAEAGRRAEARRAEARRPEGGRRQETVHGGGDFLLIEETAAVLVRILEQFLGGRDELGELDRAALVDAGGL